MRAHPDPKFDVPAIVGALATGVGYLGAMGSRRTSEERDKRLRDVGVTDVELASGHGPDRPRHRCPDPEETVVAICAEIIALRTGRIAPSLEDGSGPIHRDLESADRGT